MLLGQYLVKINEKKRTALPSKFRQEIGDKLIVAQWYEKCLVIVSQEQWKKLLMQLDNNPFYLNPARETDRFLLGSAFEIELDKQGRFIVPSILANYANLTSEAIFLGLSNRVELWSKANWQEYQDYLTENAGKIAEKLTQANITNE